MTILHAAVSGRTGSGLAYFFRGNMYCVFNWNTPTTTATGTTFNGRAVGGPYAISDEWTLPLDLQLPGFASSFDAALSGDAGGSPLYSKKLWFFKGEKYARYDYSDPPPRALDTIGSISAWKLGANFKNNVRGAFNGKESRLGYAYFFKGAEYVRYKWSTELVEAGYPKLISTLVGMPSLFFGGVDGAIDGDGSSASYGFLFRDDQYCRFNWSSVKVDNGPNHVWDDWPGVLEYLLAAEARAVALEWITDSRNQLESYIAELSTGTPSPYDTALMGAALLTHFHIPASMPTAAKIGRLQAIHAVLDRIEDRLTKLSNYLIFHDDGEVKLHNPAYVGPDGRPNYRAYTPYGDHIYMTSRYLRMSDTQFSAAAVLIHEVVHLIDDQATAVNDSPEWYVSGSAPLTTPSGQTVPFYDQLSPDIARHNPSSYNAFSQHVHFTTDRRIGTEKLRDGYW